MSAAEAETDLRIAVDKDLCIGSETCIMALPGSLRLDSSGQAETMVGEADLDDEDRKRVAEMCPTGALRLVDDDGVDRTPF